MSADECIVSYCSLYGTAFTIGTTNTTITAHGECRVLRVLGGDVSAETLRTHLLSLFDLFVHHCDQRQTNGEWRTTTTRNDKDCIHWCSSQAVKVTAVAGDSNDKNADSSGKEQQHSAQASTGHNHCMPPHLAINVRSIRSNAATWTNAVASHSCEHGRRTRVDGDLSSRTNRLYNRICSESASEYSTNSCGTRFFFSKK